MFVCALVSLSEESVVPVISVVCPDEFRCLIRSSRLFGPIISPFWPHKTAYLILSTHWFFSETPVLWRRHPYFLWFLPRRSFWMVRKNWQTFVMHSSRHRITPQGCCHPCVSVPLYESMKANLPKTRNPDASQRLSRCIEASYEIKM